ncbi:hypothetical protein ACFXP7_12845 [Microbacterium sp. P06]|uniref:hypothetical protein n=1 Tax=Microbacterium sp. P06 TaxID=3366949 RepID=UPI0037472C4C
MIDAPYVRVDRAPSVGAAGILVIVEVRPATPVGYGPQAALARALDAAGWWIGVGDDGRATVGMGTTAGPVSIAAGDPLEAGERVELVARIPGRAGGRLEITVRPADAVGESPIAARSAVIGAPLVPSPGPLLWGCRALRDRSVPEHSFVGEVGRVVVATDSAAPDDRARLAWHPVGLFVWDRVARINAARGAAQHPVSW